MYAIITTVGRSLLDNFKRSKSDKDPDHDDLVNFLKQEDPSKASAESNSLNRIFSILKVQGKNEKVKIQLLHSETAEGALCSKALRSHFERKNFTVETYQINNLHYEASKFKHLGLRSLVNTLADLIERNRKSQFKTIINATGGFKAEIAYATLVGLMYHDAVESIYYIYEGFQDIVELPALPIALDIKHWKNYQAYLELLFDGIDREQIHKHKIPQEVMFLTVEVDNRIILSPAGQVLYLGYLENKEHYEKSIQDKQRLAAIDEKGMLKVTSGEDTIWIGKKIETIRDIPEPEVKDLFTRIISFKEVQRLAFGEYHRVGKSHETHMVFKDIDRNKHTLKYELLCRAGKQTVVIVAEPGLADDLLFMLGKKIYP